MKFNLMTLLLALLLAQCQKKDPDPIDQLPPATQTGQYAFGCLLNGQPWTPKGYDGTPNYDVAYDPGYAQGTLSVAAYRYSSSNSRDFQGIGIYSDSLRSVGRYPLSTTGHHGAVVEDRRSWACYTLNPTVYCKGTLIVTRLDKQAGIISGTFDFMMYKTGCDTMKVTNGRFDYRF